MAVFPSCSHVEQKKYDLATMTEDEFVAAWGRKAYEKALKGKF
jgi:hypothetical protein